MACRLVACARVYGTQNDYCLVIDISAIVMLSNRRQQMQQLWIIQLTYQQIAFDALRACFLSFLLFSCVVRAIFKLLLCKYGMRYFYFVIGCAKSRHRPNTPFVCQSAEGTLNFRNLNSITQLSFLVAFPHVDMLTKAAKIFIIKRTQSFTCGNRDSLLHVAEYVNLPLQCHAHQVEVLHLQGQRLTRIVVVGFRPAQSNEIMSGSGIFASVLKCVNTISCLLDLNGHRNLRMTEFYGTPA